jgi:hypothetical protein
MQESLINNSGAVTVKDVSAKEFIDSFSKHLKKGNKIKMPDVSDLHLKSQCLILSIIFMYIVVPVR